MQQTTTSNLVRFHMHLRHDRIQHMTNVASTLAKRKGRDVRLGEALELALTAGFAWYDHDLLDLAPTDRESPHWCLVSPVNRQERITLTPARLRKEGAVQ